MAKISPTGKELCNKYADASFDCGELSRADKDTWVTAFSASEDARVNLESYIAGLEARVREQIDPLAPARGAVWGVLGGLAMWAVVIALVWWWRA